MRSIMPRRASAGSTSTMRAGVSTRRILIPSCARTRWPMRGAWCHSGSTGRPNRDDRRDRARIRGLLLRRGLRRRLAGAAAVADQFAGREAYVEQLAVQLKSSEPCCSSIPAELGRFLRRPRQTRPASSRATGSRSRASKLRGRASAAKPDDIAYLQYSSGIDPLSARRCSHALRAAPQPPFARLRPGRRRRRRPRASRGCHGTMTWAWSAASCRRSRSRCRSIISRPRISLAGRWPGSTSSPAIRARR